MALAAAACGKKGPPLAPLRLVPAPVSELAVRRVGSEVQLRFVLPTTNSNGPGRVELDRVEIYAVTVAPGSVVPPNRDLLTKTYLAGTIAVKPPPVEGGPAEPVEGAPPDSRPAPGDHVTFVEPLTEATRTPAVLPKTPPPVVPPVGAAAVVPTAPGELPAAPAAAPAAPTETQAPKPEAPAAPGQPPVPSAPPAPAAPDPAVPPAAAPSPGAAVAPAPAAVPPAETAPAPPVAAPTYTVRIYTVRGLTKGNRPGQPSQRLTVPLVDSPPAPSGAKASFTETALTLGWTAPSAETGAPALAYNVYRTVTDATPLNPAPLTATTFEVAGPEFGAERCFVVRALETVQNVSIEGDATERTCVTPRDIFPPAAPQRLSVVLLEGAIELLWDANAEADLAGYTVLRGEAPGDTLRALTPTPIRETTFRDTTAKPGVRHVYALVAVDRAGNASPQSARIEGTAR